MTSPARPDLWEAFAAALPPAAQTLTKSGVNVDNLTRCHARGWDPRALVDFVTRGLNNATSPAGVVAARLATAASRVPVTRAAARTHGPCAGNGVDTPGCGLPTRTRTLFGRLCCPKCLA